MGFLQVIFLVREWSAKLGLDAARIFEIGSRIVDAANTLERVTAIREATMYVFDVLERYLVSADEITIQSLDRLSDEALNLIDPQDLETWAHSQLSGVDLDEADGSVTQAIDFDRIRRIAEALAPVISLIVNLLRRGA